ncbi:class I SAM-dependent methyltransferase [Bdellovibrio sp.]|uniref:class I SAM-dependent methyltransferase n=1 Tax=Bdellovibrio sp. TaxID=28201 RepID=UPI0039E6ECCB
MNSTFKDLFSKQSLEYQKYRPSYPPELFKYLASLAPEHQVAIDLGTGNGQAALALTSYFQKVIAIDPSEKQIALAEPHERIEYRVGPGESLQISDHSVDLITIAQAFHWFKHDLFFQEAHRVLKDQGILAIWVYNLCQVTPQIDAVIFDFYDRLLGPYWEPERRLLEENFKSIHFPLTELQSRHFSMTLSWTLEQMIGYLGTWSALQSYRKKEGSDPLPELQRHLGPLWNPDETKVVHWQIHPRIFRNS